MSYSCTSVLMSLAGLRAETGLFAFVFVSALMASRGALNNNAVTHRGAGAVVVTFVLSAMSVTNNMLTCTMVALLFTIVHRSDVAGLARYDNSTTLAASGIR